MKQQAIELFKQGVAIREIARRLEKNYSTVHGWVKKHKDVAVVTTKRNPSIFVIPDTQVKHGISLGYIHDIGFYIAYKKPEIIQQIGDFYDMESLSSYDKGKKRAEGKRFINDLNAGNKALEILMGYINSVPNYKPRMVMTLGNHECLVPETEVMTQAGFKPITEVTVSDLVAQYGQDGALVWGNPKSVIKKHFKGDLIGFDSESFSFLGTPNHRMYYYMGDELLISEAKNLPVGAQMIILKDDSFQVISEDLRLSLVPYNGEVYCLEMPLDNFVIRYKNRVHITGNCRIDRYVEDNPEWEGLIGTDKLAFQDHGWEVYPFLKPVEICGIYFVHYLKSKMSSNALGGSAARRLDVMGDSYVMGHQQTLDVAMRKKPLSGKKQIGIICGACYDHDEAYMGYQGNHHFRGALLLHNCHDGYATHTPIELEYMKQFRKDHQKPYIEE